MSQQASITENARAGAVCPVTGAPVLQRAEWTNRRISDCYRITVRVIGDNIIHSKPDGYANLRDLRQALELISDIASELFGDGHRYVHVADYSSLQGASLEARRYYVEFMRQRPNLAGVVFCGTSPVFRLSIHIGTRLRILKARVAVVDTTDEAIALAARQFQSPQPPVPENPNGSAPQPKTDQGAVTRPDWDLQLRGFSLRWEVIDGHIANGLARGYLGMEHIKPAFEINHRVAEFISSSGAQVTAVIDIAGVDGITVNGRRSFVRAFRELHRVNPIRLLVFYGANALMRGALAIWRPLLPLTVVTAKDLESALEVAREGRPKRRSLSERLGLGRRSRQQAPAGSAERQIDELLRFLGTIDWEENGVAVDRGAVSADDPLSPVYDAMTLLKAELDQQLRHRESVEVALRDSEERYRTILSEIVDGYYEIDFSGKLTFCNDALLRILGYRRLELEELGTRAYLDREHSKRVMSEFRRVYDTERPARALGWELIRKDGQRIAVEASISLIRDHDGRKAGFRGIVRDITERVHAEREREELEQKLRHAQRMEAIGTLAGGIAHNFNNLLMGVQGNVSLIRTEIDPGNPHQRRLETIEELVRGGSNLTAQLLGYARSGRYEVRVLDLNRLVKQTTDTFALTRREIRVHRDLTDRPLPVRADTGQMEQVLLNLFVNAAEAMPNGGDLYVSTRESAHESSPGGRHRPGPGSHICIRIRDTGMGMSGDTAQRIFDPFFTTKGMSGGTGLGLASVYGTVKAHGGSIEVSSELGSGSTFTIYLPMTPESIGDIQKPVDEIVLGKGTVLVVDDDEAVLEACSAILSHLRYTPICAATGGQALELFSDNADEIDLVILDMVLPDISGGEVYDSLKAVDPAAKVLLSSGYSIDGQAERILGRGCDDFIQKPFTIEQLSQKIGIMLNGR